MKYKEKKSKSKNDCAECCFALSCINSCRLPKGLHYERVDEKKDKIK